MRNIECSYVFENTMTETNENTYLRNLQYISRFQRHCRYKFPPNTFVISDADHHHIQHCRHSMHSKMTKLSIMKNISEGVKHNHIAIRIFNVIWTKWNLFSNYKQGLYNLEAVMNSNFTWLMLNFNKSNENVFFKNKN